MFYPVAEVGFREMERSRRKIPNSLVLKRNGVICCTNVRVAFLLDW